MAHDAPAKVPALEDFLAGLPSRWPATTLVDSYAHQATMWALCQAVTPSVWFHGHYHHAYSQQVGRTAVTGLAHSAAAQGHMLLVDAQGLR